MALTPVERLARIVLNAVDVEALARFYVDLLGFERVDDRSVDGTVALRLGSTRLDLRQVAASATSPSIDVPAWSPRFQHFAMVVSDMALAMASLARSTAWTPITRGGPQRLPANTGGVTAFKFRDPEGHPLEFLLLPNEASGRDLFVRIDHSAITVADVDRSIAFYGGLGLAVVARSLNVGPEQQRLDDLVDACVDVVGLAPSRHATPHVELLGYRSVGDRSTPALAVDEIAATRLVCTVADADALRGIGALHADRIVERSIDALLLRDLDGHLLAFIVEGPE